MYQKDYILRMIEMLGELIAAILGLIKRGNYEQASENLDRIYHTMLKEDAAFFRAIPEDKLTDVLLQEHNYTNGHLEILARLFNAEAELCLAQGNNAGCVEYSRKSLKLFKFIDKEQKTFSFDRDNIMKLISTRIEELV